MKPGSLILRLVVMLGAIATAVPPAFAQNWTGDARRIGMGGAGTTENISSDMVADDTGLRTIVIPLGLFQVLKDLDIFRPDSDEFDIVRGLDTWRRPSTTRSIATAPAPVWSSSTTSATVG